MQTRREALGTPGSPSSVCSGIFPYRDYDRDHTGFAAGSGLGAFALFVP